MDDAQRARAQFLLLSGFMRGIIAAGFLPPDRIDTARLIADTLAALYDRDRIGKAMLTVARGREPRAAADLEFKNPDRFPIDLADGLKAWAKFEASAARGSQAAANILEGWRRHGEAFLGALLGMEGAAHEGQENRDEEANRT